LDPGLVAGHRTKSSSNIGSSSKWSKVKSGVPQGSVLGPTELLNCIIDTDECVVNRVLRFADDTKLF
jgi:hypothetical protein